MELLLVIPWLLFLTSCQLLSSMEAATQTTGNPVFPYPFITLDAEKAAARKYDYIIVGGGTAGCPLAATLSQRHTVLVLERGGSPYGNPEIENGDNFGNPLNETDKYTSIAQEVLTEDGLKLARARVLGGGTAINAGFYSRASLGFIQRMGWDEKLVNESFLWVEKVNAFKPDHLSRWSTALKDALLEVGVLPYNGYTVDHVEGTKISASTFDNHGKRHTAADLLKCANPHNIVVLLNATASRILFSSSSGVLKAHGVEFINSFNTNKSYQVLINESSHYSEVILSAGSMGSPQLLLLSGIGPYKNLKKLNISVVKHVPLVGQGVQDNPRATIAVQSPIPLNTSSIQSVGILNNSELYIFSSSFVQQASSNGSKSTNMYGGVIFEKLAYPLSRGNLSLISRDPRDNPSVRYNYYSNPKDLQKCVRGVKIIARICETNSIQKFAYKDKSNDSRRLHFIGPALPNIKDEVAIAKFCRENLNTMWHFHGGCDIGSVIDKKYKVKGVDALRVVDGSTFRDAPGTNPQATTLMLGRYIGVKILQERGDST
ncbi:hypothetical protein SUGI_0697300 [Cryptomeria japonica]|uniref:(R)-mandelonitrile lyase-like n=1 Tax=Cryptomeria japonica TaxID=3369 RepID=UPI002414796D|nr:(R)-mandelonitrile lyase-like [Cryptomeria japonica]GLJ34666.1 hypothetical protein SUGI_0697300 [Cryptomeria japonica]